MSLQFDSDILRAALAGYQQQLEHIEAKVAELRRQLRVGAAQAKSMAAPAAAPKRAKRSRKHRMSAEGRARIAAAQRARWAKVKRAKKPSSAASRGK
jgi:cell division septum initiation protein DivIVA